jgi:hypothetical protein
MARRIKRTTCMSSASGSCAGASFIVYPISRARIFKVTKDRGIGIEEGSTANVKPLPPTCLRIKYPRFYVKNFFENSQSCRRSAGSENAWQR